MIALQRRYPRCKVHLLVLTSTAARRAEAAAAAKALVKASARGEVRICELPDGLLPAHFLDVKAEFERIKKAINPDLVLTHHGLDRHQDHSLVSEVTWQTFRDHMIWEYEIPKFDGDLATPNMYVPLPSRAGCPENCADHACVSFTAWQAVVQGGESRGNNAPAWAREPGCQRIRGRLPLPKAVKRSFGGKA